VFLDVELVLVVVLSFCCSLFSFVCLLVQFFLVAYFLCSGCSCAGECSVVVSGD
jgi:hypothetical protein